MWILLTIFSSCSESKTSDDNIFNNATVQTVDSKETEKSYLGLSTIIIQNTLETSDQPISNEENQKDNDESKSFSFINEKISFEIPADIRVQKYGISSGNGKAMITVLANAETGWDLYSAERNINSAIFEKQLTEDNFEIIPSNMERLLQNNADNKNVFVLHKSTPGFLKESRTFLKYEDRLIGESLFYVPPISEYPFNQISYDILFIAENTLLNINIDFREKKNNNTFPIQFPNFFSKIDGEFYWKDEDAVMEFYDLLESNEYNILPEEIMLLRETKEHILSTLKIDNNKEPYYEDDKFLSQFTVSSNVQYGLHMVQLQEDSIYATIINNRGYILSEPSTIYGTVFKAAKEGQRISVLEYSLEKKIDKLDKPRWYKIKSQDGTVGWLDEYLLKIAVEE